MAKVARIPITNTLMGGDYTGRLCVGPDQQPMNVILDTGSSALALDGQKYKLDKARGDKSTHLAQCDTYNGSQSWTGAIIETKVSIGEGATSVGIKNANVALTYDTSPGIFKQADGILGLAYAALDDAFTMAEDTSSHRYTPVEVRTGHKQDLQPYLTQLATEGVAPDKLSFFLHRSFKHVGGPAGDPLNHGWMIVGGGEESTDLHEGGFKTVKVLSRKWYSTNLKEIIVGASEPISAPSSGPKDMPSNSYIDSGTNSLSLGKEMLTAMLSKFTPAQQKLLSSAVFDRQLVEVADLHLAAWPTLTFVLEGTTEKVSLEVKPADYWQVNTQKVGSAAAAITEGTPELYILGLPLLSGYFTIFDGEPDEGRGIIKFARKKPN